MRVLVTVPNLGWVHRQVLGVVVNMLVEGRCEIEFDAPLEDPPYDNALNVTAKRFHEGNCDFWLNIDADNPPSRNPIELCGLDRDVIGCPTPNIRVGRKPLVQWMAYRIVDGKHVSVDGQGLERVDAISSGAMLIARRVFENPEMRKHPFLSIYNEHGIRIQGPDLSFCARARKQGFEIYAHFDYPSRHYKEVELGELLGKL